MADLRGAIKRARAAELTVEPLIDVVAEFGTVVGDSVGKRYNVDNSRAARFLRDYMAERVQMINGTTRSAVQKALASADPKSAVKDVFRDARDRRAEMIAHTEIARGSSWAAVDAGKWVAALDFKRWASLMDGDERHTHHVMHDQVVGWNEKFVSPSGAKAPGPGQFDVADEDVNCRCAALPSRAAQRRELGDFGDAQAQYEGVRAPFVREMTAAWRRVFDEQELAVLAGLE